MNKDMLDLTIKLNDAEENLDKICRRYGESIASFYKNPGSFPKEFYNECCYEITLLNSILEKIFELKHGKDHNIAFLADYK